MSDKNTLSQALTSVIRHPDYKREIAVLLRGNLAPGQLQKKLEDYHERDTAEALELLRQDERCRLYALLDAATLAGVLVGAIDLKELIIARENTALEDILMTSYPYVYTDELIEDCVERIRGYSEDSIPVLNADNRLCGVLTAQVVAELVADKLGDDYAKLGGLTAEEDLQEPLRRSIFKRLP